MAGNSPLRFGSRPTDNNDNTSDSNEQSNEQVSNTTGGANTAEANHARVTESEKQDLKPVSSKTGAGARYSDQNPDRAANELGITSTAGQDSKDEGAHVAVADAGSGDDESDVVLYTCHPTQNLAFGPYQFEKSVLRLKPEDAAKFDELLEKLPAYEANKVSKIDKARVDQIVKQRQQATQLNDSSMERRALEDLGQNGGRQFGTEEVGASAANQQVNTRTDDSRTQQTEAEKQAAERDYNQG